MKKENLLFYKNIETLNQNPKWKMNLVLLLLFTTFSALISTSFITKNQKGLSTESGYIDGQTIHTVTQVISTTFGVIYTILSVLTFTLVVIVITKIFKKNVRNVSILSSIVYMYLIVSGVSLAGLIVQAAVNLNPIDYNILSLNIFSKNNEILSLFNVPLILKGYLIALIMYITCKFSIKLSISIVVVIILLQLILGITTTMI